MREESARDRSCRKRPARDRPWSPRPSVPVLGTPAEVRAAQASYDLRADLLMDDSRTTYSVAPGFARVRRDRLVIGPVRPEGGRLVTTHRIRRLVLQLSQHWPCIVLNFLKTPARDRRWSLRQLRLCPCKFVLRECGRPPGSLRCSHLAFNFVCLPRGTGHAAGRGRLVIGPGHRPRRLGLSLFGFLFVWCKSRHVTGKHGAREETGS